MKKLWEVLVPTEMLRDGKVKPIRTRYHRLWDAKVRSISGGMTILSPVKGQWVSHEDNLVAERMIPVRIIADTTEIMAIIKVTIEHYEQDAVLAYEISQNVLLVTAKEAANAT